MSSQQPPPKAMMFWIIWFAISGGLLVSYFMFGQSATISSASSSAFPLGLVTGIPPLIISVALRWVVLPRINDAQKALSTFVVGLALAESCAMMGIFLDPQNKNLLVILGLFGLLQYVPLFASRFEPDKGAPPNTKVI